MAAARRELPMIETRLAHSSDRDALITFIRDHWSKDHVFVHAPDLFDWQYLQGDGRLNMMMAAQDGKILGILGFIPMGRFDPSLGDTDLFLAIWKVREDLAPPGLGLRLLKSLQAQLKPRMIAAIGISEMVAPIYRALGYTLGRLHHAAIVNPSAGEGEGIASGIPANCLQPAVLDVLGWRIEQVSKSQLTADRTQIAALARLSTPAKSWNYVQERYVDHPYYNYEFALIWKDAELSALAIWRKVSLNGGYILRIVDVVGDTEWMAAGHALLLPIIQSSGANYMDIMQLGTAEETLRAGGWLSPDWVPGLVLPNYFAPFEPRNVEINLAYRCFGPVEKPLRLYRADSDQDRPNQAPVPLSDGQI
jgi:hypothetical protein